MILSVALPFWGWGFLLPLPEADFGTTHEAPVSLVLVRQAELTIFGLFPWFFIGNGVPFHGHCVSRLGEGLSSGPCSSSGIGSSLGDVGCGIDALAGMELRWDGG